MTELIPLLFVVAMAAGGFFRAWADDRQDTRSRYTVFDVVCTGASGLFAPQLLEAAPWLGPWSKALHPLAMAGLLFVLSALLSLLVFETARQLAPGIVGKLAARAQGKLGVTPLLLATLLLAAAAADAGVGITHGYADCGATSTATGITAQSGTDRYRILTLVNDSDTTIYLKLDGTAAVANQGHRLNSNGGTLILDVETPNGALTCIHASSGSKRLLWWHDAR